MVTGDDEKSIERPCGSDQPKDSDEPEIPIPEVDCNLWEFPNVQRMPSSLTAPSGRMESLNAISVYASAMMFEGGSKKAGPNKIPGPPSKKYDEEDLIQRKIDEDSQSSTSHRRNELSDSLRVLPGRITRMEEQWKDTLGEIQRFITHSDACMGEMTSELLNVKKLALTDADSVRDMANETKRQTYIQVVDHEAMRRKLCLHGEQLKKMED